jgi:hypothetical protein
MTEQVGKGLPDELSLNSPKAQSVTERLNHTAFDLMSGTNGPVQSNGFHCAMPRSI